MGPPSPLIIAPSHGVSGPHLIHGSLDQPQVLKPSGISIGSTVFAGLTTVTERYNATQSVTIGRINTVLRLGQ